MLIFVGVILGMQRPLGGFTLSVAVGCFWWEKGHEMKVVICVLLFEWFSHIRLVSVQFHGCVIFFSCLHRHLFVLLLTCR